MRSRRPRCSPRREGVGMPLLAGASGWLLAGRKPDVIARQPVD
jgi:hypothetical protein